MIGYIIILIIVGIIVSIITEQLLIRRLRLEEGVTISKGKCILKPGYGLIPPVTPVLNQPSGEMRQQGSDFSGIGRNNLTDNELSGFYKPYLK